jgi:mannose-6-phosphate isomerase-like protein (cupin superfamily)
MVKELVYNKTLLAILVSNSFKKEGVHFFTQDDLSQQLAYMQHPKGKIIIPHVHNSVKREVHYTQEVLVIKRGRLRVDFYSENQKYLESWVLGEGDVLLLATGGHGFEVLDDVEMVEIKQGPYAGDHDKTRFDGVDTDELTLTRVYENG